MLALESAYNGGDDWLNQLLHYLKGNLDYLSRYVEKNIPQVKVISPEATYMAWMDFRELGMKDKELKRFLVTKAKVGMNDGTAFGPGGSGFMRMNFACPHVVLKEALDRIKKAIHHQ
jgi:cystathionine beta-lyase